MGDLFHVRGMSHRGTFPTISGICNCFLKEGRFRLFSCHDDYILALLSTKEQRNDSTTET